MINRSIPLSVLAVLSSGVLFITAIFHHHDHIERHHYHPHPERRMVFVMG